MEWTDTALVLHVGRFRETDMWLRLLSRRRGILSVFAFGGSRSRKRFCGCLDLLNTLSCRVKSTRNGSYLALEEGVLLRGPQRLRSDWTRLGPAMNCVRFLDALGVTRDGAADAFGLLEATLACLEEPCPPHALFPLFFRLRLASDQGFAPALDKCSRCGAKNMERGSFLMDEGQMLCPSCTGKTSSTRYAVDVPPGCLDILRAVQREAPARWNVALTPTQRRACATVIDGFVQYHLGIAWENGRFRRV